MKSFEANGDEETFRDRLGNLTLPSGKRNRLISNKPFSEKVKHYAKSELRVTSEIARTQETWTASKVAERQKELQVHAKDAWSID